MANNPDYMELPSASGHGWTTAEGFAKLMGILANGGSHKGKIILSPSAVAKMSEPMTPMSEDLVMSGIETMVGRGVHLLDCPRVRSRLILL